MKENWKRIVLGLLLVYLIGRIGSHVLSMFEPSEPITAQEYLSIWPITYVMALGWQFVAYTVGGYVAQTKFLIPAIVYGAYGWIEGVVGFARQSATIDGAGSLSELVFSAVWGLLPALPATLLVAALGSTAGMAFYRRTRHRFNT